MTPARAICGALSVHMTARAPRIAGVAAGLVAGLALGVAPVEAAPWIHAHRGGSLVDGVPTYGENSMPVSKTSTPSRLFNQPTTA